MLNLQLRITLFLALVMSSFVTQADDLHAHRLYQNVLSEFVVNNHVNYAGLKAQPVELQAYLATLSQVKESDYKAWGKSQQMAYLINLYNAATLKLIIQHYPVNSIHDIGSIFRNAWQKKFILLFGKQVSLDYVEHDLLRDKFADARIHFALVYAAKSCPPLRQEAYLAHKLDQQLDEQGRLFLADPSKNRIDLAEKRIYLSKIFSWFKEDFRDDGEDILDVISPYLPPHIVKQMQQTRFHVYYMDYDWALNEATGKPTSLAGKPLHSSGAASRHMP